MDNIIGLNTRLYGSNLNIAPAVESQEEEQVEETTPERVLNPIVSESYMKGYIKDEGLIKPEGNIELTENAENVDIAQYATATVNVSGGGGIENPILTLEIVATDVVGDLGTIDYLTVIEDNTIKNKSGIMIAGGNDYEFEILVPAWDNGDDPDVFVWTNSSAGNLVATSKVITATTTENCIANIDQEHYSMYIMVTDPTQPASATLTVTNS